MEHEYTVAELKKMLLEAEKKEQLERKKAEEEKKRILTEQKEARLKEITDLYEKLNRLIESYCQDYVDDFYPSMSVPSWTLRMM